MPKGKIFYHGSGTLFDKIDVSQGLAKKDFGRGFYLSEKMFHAESMAKRKSRYTGNAYIYKIEIPGELDKHCNSKNYVIADEEWLDFIIYNRYGYGEAKHYDMVEGFTADAITMGILDIVVENIKEGFTINKTEVIEKLKPSVYPRQLCFCNQEVADQLRIIEISEMCGDIWRKIYG